MKKYFVMVQDEYNNLWYVGNYDSLQEAVEPVNEILENYDIKIDTIEEYTSTFGMCFDKVLDFEDGSIMIRGFIFE